MRRLKGLILALAVYSGAAGAEPPLGWSVAGSAPTEYRYTTDRTVAVPGSAASAAIEGNVSAAGFGTLMQTISADDFRSGRVRLSVYLRTENAGRAQAWLRVDARDGRVLAFDNMAGRAVVGSTDWRRYDVVLDVPADAARLAFGFLLRGKGKVWADSFALEGTGTDVPVTAAPASLPSKPRNLGFDDPEATTSR